MPSTTAKPEKPKGPKTLLKATTELIGQFGVGTQGKLARPQEITPDGTASFKTINVAGSVASYRSAQSDSLTKAVKGLIDEHADTSDAADPKINEKRTFKQTLTNWKTQADVSFNHFMDQVEGQLTTIAKQQQATNGTLNPLTAYDKLKTESEQQLKALKSYHANELREVDTFLNSDDFTGQLQNLGYDGSRIAQTKESLKQNLQAEQQQREEKFTTELYNEKILKEQGDLVSAYSQAMLRMQLHQTYKDLGLPNAKDPIEALNARANATGVANPITGENVQMPDPIGGKYPSTVEGRWIAVQGDGLIIDVVGLGAEARQQYIRDAIMILKMQGYTSINLEGEDKDLLDDIWEEAMLMGMGSNYTPRATIPPVRAVQNSGYRTRPAHETLAERQRAQQELTDNLKEIDKDQNGELVNLDNVTQANEEARQKIRLRAPLTEIDDTVEQRLTDSTPGASDEQRLMDLASLEEKHEKQLEQMDNMLTDCDVLKSRLTEQHRATQSVEDTLEKSTFTQKTPGVASKLASTIQSSWNAVKSDFFSAFVPNFIRPLFPSALKIENQSLLQAKEAEIQRSNTKQLGAENEATPADMNVEQAQRVAKLNKAYQKNDLKQNIEVIYLAHQHADNQLTKETARLAVRQAKLDVIKNKPLLTPKENQLATNLQNKINQSRTKIAALTTKLNGQQNDMNNIHNNPNTPNMSDRYQQLSQPGAQSPSVSL